MRRLALFCIALSLLVAPAFASLAIMFQPVAAMAEALSGESPGIAQPSDLQSVLSISFLICAAVLVIWFAATRRAAEIGDRETTFSPRDRDSRSSSG